MSTKIDIRVTEKEKNLVEKLANYLYKAGKIEKETLSDAMRLCLHYTCGEIFKGIEADRYAG